MEARKHGTRSRRSRDSPVPTPCVETQCFDPLIRECVACKLLRTPDPPQHAFGPLIPRPPSESPSPSTNSRAPRTVLQPQESVGTGPGRGDTTLPLPGLLFGGPALLGLVLLVVLVALVIWRWSQQRRMASLDIPNGVQEESLDNVYVVSPETLHASAPIWPTPKEDVDTTLPGHSIPVPATELGSTELVTTKTAGSEE